MKKLAVKKKPLPKKSFPKNYKEQQRKNMENFAKHFKARDKVVGQISKLLAKRDIPVKERATLDAEYDFSYIHPSGGFGTRMMVQHFGGKTFIVVDAWHTGSMTELSEQDFNVSTQGIHDAVEAFVYLSHRFFEEEKRILSSLKGIARDNIEIDVDPKVNRPAVTLTVPDLSEDDARRVLELINNFGGDE